MINLTERFNDHPPRYDLMFITLDDETKAIISRDMFKEELEYEFRYGIMTIYFDRLESTDEYGGVIYLYKHGELVATITPIEVKEVEYCRLPDE